MDSGNPNQDYIKLVEAYDYFNQKIFDGHLPDVLITLRGNRSFIGYFCPAEFSTRQPESRIKVDGLAINPQYLSRTDIEILSTLVHEQCHVWQEHFGKPSKGSYHNVEWATKMLAVGLTPFSNSNHDLMTGTSMSHTIMPDGRFQQLATALLDTGWTLTITELPPTAMNGRAAQKKKVKYTCPDCQTKVWGRPNLHIGCNDCGVEFTTSD